MKKIQFLALAMAAATVLVQPSCTGTSSGSAGTDSIGDTAQEAPALVGDSAINRASAFYAGVSRDGISISESDAADWDKYSAQIKEQRVPCEKTCATMDSLVNADCADFRDSVDYVFYPFSGADVMFPTTIYPDADTYFMCGLEKTGTPISTEVKTNYAFYEAYRGAMSNFFKYGYFITKEMHSDLHNAQIDGVCPVMTLLMAAQGYEVISIDYCTVDANGQIAHADKEANMLQIKFFKRGSNHEQTLIYYTGDVQDKNFDPGLKKYLDGALSQHTVGTYLKAASFLMHWDSFSMMRNLALDHSLSIIQDDTGIPYRFLSEKYDVTLYGAYQHPSREFDVHCYQHDLEALYAANDGSVKPLPFRLGYTYSRSQWQIARHKK